MAATVVTEAVSVGMELLGVQFDNNSGSEVEVQANDATTLAHHDAVLRGGAGKTRALGETQEGVLENTVGHFVPPEALDDQLAGGPDSASSAPAYRWIRPAISGSVVSWLRTAVSRTRWATAIPAGTPMSTNGASDVGDGKAVDRDDFCLDQILALVDDEGEVSFAGHHGDDFDPPWATVQAVDVGGGAMRGGD